MSRVQTPNESDAELLHAIQFSLADLVIVDEQVPSTSDARPVSATSGSELEGTFRFMKSANVKKAGEAARQAEAFVERETSIGTEQKDSQ